MAREDLLQEATDPTTDPARLRQLARQENEAVHRAAWMNPSVPEDIWRTALLWGHPEAWDNPMAPIYLLTWTPREDDWRPLEAGARWATEALWKNPERCSSEGKALIVAKVREWWATSEESEDMMVDLGKWAKAKGKGSVEHREVVRILVLCVRTAPHLTVNDQKALNLLETWMAGGQDLRKKDETLASHEVVKEVYRFALSPVSLVWNAIRMTVEAVAPYNQGTMYEEAKTEHQRRLADLIRREKPLPPVVE